MHDRAGRPVLALLAALLAACAAEPPPGTDSAASGPPPMPLPLSNNAVAQAEVAGQTRFYSFMGLGAGKSWLDISRRAFEFAPASGRWIELPPVPVLEGRLASVAAAAGGRVYLFGGYTVALDGHEVSTPEVFAFDPAQRRYAAKAPMPTPVDDSVALVWRERWIYLVSGWHMDANLGLVQVYDSHTDAWTTATPYPGTPVFGHAGAILGDTLLVCDGVKLRLDGGRRRFEASDECWGGQIGPDDPRLIAWRRVAGHPGPPRYRMGAAADPAGGRLIFAGGSEVPYNFDGIGYDGRPAPASDRVQAYLPGQDRWQELPPLPEPSMDHRGLLRHHGHYYLLGGMRDPQRVSASVIVYEPD